MITAVLEIMKILGQLIIGVFSGIFNSVSQYLAGSGIRLMKFFHFYAKG